MNMLIKVTLKSKNFKYTPKPRKKRILIIGDCHVRVCACKISNYLGKEFEYSGTVMPGSGLANVTALCIKNCLH